MSEKLTRLRPSWYQWPRSSIATTSSRATRTASPKAIPQNFIRKRQRHAAYNLRKGSWSLSNATYLDYPHLDELMAFVKGVEALGPELVLLFGSVATGEQDEFRPQGLNALDK